MNTMRNHLVPAASGLAVMFALVTPAPAQDVLGSFQGDTPDAGFGRSLSRAGDVDADGIGDWIVGAPRDVTGGPDAGAVRVVSGADGSTLHEWFGAPGDELGTAVTALGDIDKDGRGDVAAGAPGSHGGATAGYVVVWSGATGDELLHVSGAFPGGRFGQAVTGVGDVSGDGRPELAVGAPLESGATGNVYVLSGSGGALIGAPLSGHAGGDLFGGGLAFDMDAVVGMGEAGPGVIIGATQAGNGGPGYVEVYDLHAGQVLAAAVTGAAPGDAFGSAVAAVGDVDGDGTIDFAAGDAPAGQASTALLLSGADGSVLGSFANEWSDGGLSLGPAGDVDGDGVPDLAMGEPHSDAHGVGAGTLRLWSGADGVLLHVIHGASSGEGFGATLTEVGDLDGDGRADLAVGALAGGAGEVWLLAMRPYTDLGNGLPGVDGIPRLTGQDGLVAGGEEVTLVLDSARPVAEASLLLGYSTYIDPATDKLVPSPDIVVDGLVTSTDGRIETTFEWPEGVPPGTTVYYQFHVLDPNAAGGVSRSNTVVGSMP